jgi:hypothetical protein
VLRHTSVREDSPFELPSRRVAGKLMQDRHKVNPGSMRRLLTQ